MWIPFVKANACGNDFLIVEGDTAAADLGELSKKICDRHTGVGADGVEWLFPSRNADIQARLFNADGSEAEISGNGTRCVAAYLCSQKLDEANDNARDEKIAVTILTGAGSKDCELVSHSNNEYEFEIAMGVPQVGKEISVEFGPRMVPGIPVSMGNPHLVVFVNEFAPGWQIEAAQIGKSARFPQGTNVELVKVVNQSNIEVRLFERGVGETQSSGTGSCASAAAAITSGYVKSPVRVHAPGGTQTVSWDNEVSLRGGAQLVCRGEVFI